MGSYTFTRPPPDTRAYVTGICGKPPGQCEMDRYHRGKPRVRLTRLASEAFCGCGAPLTDVVPIVDTSAP